jgi:rhodanese-related sulfurtransferase
MVASADGSGGNRYSGDVVNFNRDYHSEISASAAYLATNPPQGFGRGKNSAVILDVRTVEEYVGGHPPGAYSIPFPHIHERGCASADPVEDPECFDENGESIYIGQTDGDFVAAVDELGLPEDALIITMCRTGARSVRAGNLLAAAGYTNVRNMSGQTHHSITIYF